MKLNIKPLLSATLLATGFASISTAHADGFYLLGNVGNATLEHSIERSLGANAPTLPAPDAGGVSTVQETDFSVGVGIGYRANLTKDFFWGIEGFYQGQNVDSRNINGVLVTDIELDSSYGARLLGGVNINDKASIYAIAGVTALDFDINNSYTFAPPVRSRSETESGFTFGLGGDYKLNNRYAVFAQVLRTTDIDFDGIPEVAGNTGRVNPNELDFTEFNLGIRYTF